MRSEQEALLATVAANPDDDLPRLVYADWLDEHAQSEADRGRATFIRAQVAEWRDPFPWETDAADPDAPRPSLALLARHRDDWLGFLPEKQRAWVNFERGFPEELRPAGVRTGFVKLLDKPHPELATVRRLRLPRPSRLRPVDYLTLANSPGLARVRALEFEDDADGKPVSWLLESSHLAGLIELAFLDGVDGLHRLLDAAPPGVHTLYVREVVDQDPFDPPDGLRGLRSVERLYFGGAPDGDGSWQDALGRPDVAPALASLRVDTDGNDTTTVRLFATVNRPALRRLSVGWGGARSGDAIARAAAGNPGLAGLTALGVSCAAVSAAVAVEVIESPHLRNVRRLDLRLSDKAADAAAVFEHLLANVSADRFDKLWVGHDWPESPFADRLRDKFGARLQTRTDDALHQTLERLGQW